MKKLIPLLTGFFFISGVFAQQEYFVYLQTDNKQPFYIKLNEKVFSSTPAGYVVIPALKNGEHNFIAGFPKAEWPQQNWVVKINNKDEGFILKNFDTKGWGLFNLHTLDVSYAIPASNKETPVKNSNADPFSEMLAAVVNTPSLNDVTIQEKPAEEVPVIKEEPIKKEEEIAVATPVMEAPKTIIHKISSVEDKEGRAMTFIDQSDTIKVFIPAEVVMVKSNTEPGSSEANEVKVEPVVVPDTVMISSQPVVVTPKPADKEPQPNSPAFIDIELPNPNSQADTSKSNTTGQPVQQPGVGEEALPSGNALGKAKPVIEIFNSDCKKIANEDDFLKLRKKMVAYATDDEMVNTARKVFKTRCFTTEQVKNLSVLFLSDAGKYQFFDAVYPFVYDSSKFPALLSQLSDPYYINRFKAMVRI